jgi:hypothetical protein
LKHLRQTLEKNIQDNYLKGQVEFILLDYNSQDGLQDWVYHNMQKYIEDGILVYFKTIDPTLYLRSHSRNMAFRLANSTILCNLDADNFLGKGFAGFMLEAFSNNDNIFCTNDCSSRDAFGRISIRNRDFISVRGYNEALQCYGYEDGDIQNRLMLNGLKPVSVRNPEFYHCITHSFKERISEEAKAKNLYEMYISYINPYTSSILLLNKDYSLEQYTLIDNAQQNIIVEYSSIFESVFDGRSRIVQHGNILKGTWGKNDYNILINIGNVEYQVLSRTLSIKLGNMLFYKIQDDELKAKIIVLITDAINYKEATEQINDNLIINPDGFGKGIVYKNFDLSNKIILS